MGDSMFCTDSTLARLSEWFLTSTFDLIVNGELGSASAAVLGNSVLFQRLTLDQAKDETWDVIIAGSSFSAMFFLLGLSPELRVLIVEKGELATHEDWVGSVRGQYRDRVEIETSAHIEKDFIAHTLFGGNSNCWTGQVPRFHPNDFRSSELYGIGAPWDLTFDEIEPLYAEVEAVMEVAGGSSEYAPRRSTPFPYPPHEVSRSDRFTLEAFPEFWMPSPSARSNGGTRPTCCANSRCAACPIDAKFTILNGIDRFPYDRASLVTGAEARSVEIEAGRVRALIVRDESGVAHTLTSNGPIALATNAMFNAAIMMRSGIEMPALGRYLSEQLGLFLQYDIDVPSYFGGTMVPALCWAFYDGEFRREAASVLVESFNDPRKFRLEKGLWTHTAVLKLIADDIPSPENRVVLDEAGNPRIIWTGHSDYAVRGIERAEAMIQDVFPFKLLRLTDRRWSVTEAHIQGTHRMGTDAKDSVVDAAQRVHGVEGLFALGSGSFPTVTAANPTLTLSALALRSGRSV